MNLTNNHFWLLISTVTAKIYKELTICFKSAQWDHPERNIKSSKTKY